MSVVYRMQSRGFTVGAHLKLNPSPSSSLISKDFVYLNLVRLSVCTLSKSSIQECERLLEDYAIAHLSNLVNLYADYIPMSKKFRRLHEQSNTTSCACHD